MEKLLSERRGGAADDLNCLSTEEIEPLLIEVARLMQRNEARLSAGISAQISDIASRHGVGYHDVMMAVFEFLDELETGRAKGE